MRQKTIVGKPAVGTTEEARALQGTGQRREVRTANKGLRIDVQAGGSASYICSIMRDGERAKFTLGSTAVFTYEEALTRFRALQRAAAEGASIADLKNLFKRQARDYITTSHLLDRFFNERILPRRAVPASPETLIRLYMRPAYGTVPASELTVDHLIAPIREMLANGRLGNAANCYTLTKQFSSWCWRHHLLSEDVMGRHRKEDIFGPNDHPAEHDRVLTNAEMTAFFSLLPPPGRRDESDLTVKLLLLTGLRISELVNLPRDYFDPQAATLTIPAELQKRRGKLGLANTPPHVVPLGPRGLAVAKRLAAISQGHERLVCSSEGLELARQSVRKAVDFDCRALGMAHFTLHDLRRTYRSRLAELGVDYFLSEHLICHTLPPAQRVYQRGDMVELGREANVLLENSIAPYVWPASRVERPGPGPKASKNLPTWAVPQAAAV